jgi:hypothetical protein
MCSWGYQVKQDTFSNVVIYTCILGMDLDCTFLEMREGYIGGRGGEGERIGLLHHFTRIISFQHMLPLLVRVECITAIS